MLTVPVMMMMMMVVADGGAGRITTVLYKRRYRRPTRSVRSCIQHHCAYSSRS